MHLRGHRLHHRLPVTALSTSGDTFTVANAAGVITRSCTTTGTNKGCVKNSW